MRCRSWPTPTRDRHVPLVPHLALENLHHGAVFPSSCILSLDGLSRFVPFPRTPHETRIRVCFFFSATPLSCRMDHIRVSLSPKCRMACTGRTPSSVSLSRLFRIPAALFFHFPPHLLLFLSVFSTRLLPSCFLRLKRTFMRLHKYSATLRLPDTASPPLTPVHLSPPASLTATPGDGPNAKGEPRRRNREKIRNPHTSRRKASPRR